MSASIPSPTSTFGTVQIDHHAFFNASPLPQAVLDATWRVAQANPAWIALTGGSVGLPWYDLAHAIDLARDLPVIGRVQTGGLATHRSLVRLRTPDGGWSTADLLVSALPDGQEGSLVTVLPSTAAVIAASAVLPAAGDDGRQLAAALSHDVRQHARLAAVYCSLLARSQLDERQRAQLTVVATHAERLQHILGSLVHWLRLADDPLDRHPCDLAQLWSAATADLPADVEHEPLPVINGDPQLLGELLRELALNAVRYRGGRARIAVQAVHDDHGWELRISDDGPGIPLAERERVLLPLHRLHSWEEVAGHGMGLALASRIAARHGGGLRIAEAPGGGCMVQVRLPG